MRKIKPVYITKVGADGKGHRMRDMPALRKAIIKVLTANEEGLSLRTLTEQVSAGDNLTLISLEELYVSGDVQRFNAYNPKRCRTDEFWCVAGRSPVRQGNRFRGLETLQAFQIAARQVYGQGVGA